MIPNKNSSVACAKITEIHSQNQYHFFYFIQFSISYVIINHNTTGHTTMDEVDCERIFDVVRCAVSVHKWHVLIS